MRNYKRIYIGLMAHIEDKVTGKYSQLISDEEMHYMSKFVAAIPMNKVAYTLQNTDVLKSPDGEEIDIENLKYFVKIVCELSVSKYMDAKTMKDTYFNSAMPYFMYCHKLHNGTPYVEWANHKNVKLVLGKHLRALRSLSNPQIKEILNYSLDDIMKLRTLALVRAGKAQPVTGWTLVKTKQNTVFDSLPKCVRLMVLQTWVLNVATRHKYMILDPLNWDLIPTAVDELSTMSLEDSRNIDSALVNGLEVGDIL